jgi:2-keto-4-pentenoate hydratase/2-oxohepta-3-ene-1,7-dioic acid hydratase in catechol pathway
VKRPGKIVGVERNYGSRPEPPRFFLRPPSCLVAPGEAIVLPPDVGKVVAQCEIGIVIGREARDIAPEDVDDRIAGYTCLNDVTAIDQFLDPEMGTVAKWYDTFMPIGPEVVPELPAGGAGMTCRVNGELKLDGHTSGLRIGIPELISRLSWLMTLVPGDLVMSGGPGNLPPIEDGDEVVVCVEGVGELRNPVLAAVRVRA